MNLFFELILIYLSAPWFWWGSLIILFLVGSVFVTRFLVGHSLLAKVLPAPQKKIKRAVASCWLLTGLVLFAGFVGFLMSQIMGLLSGVLLALVLGIGFKFKNQRHQQQQLRVQLPLFLRALGSTLRAGYSVPQALEFVALEVQNPLRESLQSGVYALRWQQPLEQVLADWREQIKVPEFDFLADSLLFQSRSGGSLADLCNNIAYLLEERVKLERDIQSFTAQGKMSGYLMAGLWPMSLLLFAWLAPHHTDVLFKTLPGQILLGISFSLAAIGFYFMWRLIRLKI